MAELDDTIQKIKSDYDAAAYESHPYRQTHPDRLAAEAALHGLAAAPVEQCTVLEIGCATGGNLIPMAEQLQQSRFLGIDLSPSQIETGSKIVGELGLGNIELRCQNLMDFPENAGTFDYIIAHGFYSWVPEAVQQRLMEVCRRHLSPHGLAYISYNTYPGWRIIEPTREMMLYHSRRQTDPMERIARGRKILQVISEQTPAGGLYRESLRGVKQLISGKSDHQLLHDEFAVMNIPVYFWAFIEKAKQFGLEYVEEVGARQNPWDMLSPSLREIINQICDDPLDREQYLDFLVNRSFRCSLLRRKEAPVAADIPLAERMRSLHIAESLPEIAAGNEAAGQRVFEFTIGDYKVHVSNPQAVELLRHIRAAWPAAIPFQELHTLAAKTLPAGVVAQNASDELAKFIKLYARMGLLELWPRPTDFIAETANLKPRVTRYARWQAVHANAVSTLRHEAINLTPSFRSLLPLLDGTRDKKALCEELTRKKEPEPSGAWQPESVERLEQMIDAALKLMVSSSLLLNEKTGD